MPLIFLFSLMLISFSSWSYSVATQQETLSNPALKRTLNVRIFYPSESHQAATLQAVRPVLTGFYAIEQAQPAAGKFPLIVLSHGSGGNNSSLAWLAVPLAAQGAIVIAANHPGSTTGDSSPDTDLTLQTRDLSFLITHYLDDARWRPAIDANRIGAIGHSKGGYSVLALAGARITQARLVEYCRSKPQMPDCLFYQRGHLPLAQRSAATLAASYRDPRVKFVVAIDPGMSDVFTRASLHSITLPLLVIAAGYYIRAQPEINLGVDRLPLPLLRLPQAGHYDFLPQCQPAAQAILAEEGEAFICETSREKREEVHQQTITAVSAFIQRS
ncbi:alpha/beta hydrolase family protein [Erwinia aphidicola]|uniref:alpha/beta hydrolase family protein n=1 Tax=Erwinia aphidicola TaxID=68334 RepID=UPI003D1D53D1